MTYLESRFNDHDRYMQAALGWACSRGVGSEPSRTRLVLFNLIRASVSTMSDSSAPPILPEQAIILGDIAKGAQSYLATLGRNASTRYSTAHLIPGDSQIDASEAEVSQSCQLVNDISQPTTSEESNILSGQIWANLLKMSLPIGTSSNDEDILVDTLCKSSKRRQTYKEALESLHGVSDMSRI